MLTPRQEEVLDYISNYMRRNGLPPTRIEIMEQFGFASPNAAQCHIKALEAKGYLTVQPGKSRSAMPTNRTEANGGNDWLPLVGRVAAGQPILAEEHIENHLPVPLELFPERGDYLLRVVGDSMLDRGIAEGHLLVVKKVEEPPPDGAIIVARLNGEVTVKMWRRMGTRIFLIPANLRYDTMVLDLDEGLDFTVEGVVIGLIRRGIGRY